MDTSPLAILKSVVPRTPLILKTAFSHTLGLSATSSKLDLKQEVIVRVVRDLLGPSSVPKRMSSAQRQSIKDPGVKGRKWVSRYTIPAPSEGDVLDRLSGAIEALGDGEFDKPDLVAVEVEWTGYRKHAGANEPEPSISEEEKYSKLQADVTSDVVVLYLHGGALYLMDPASHRHVTSRLAKETGGKTMSVRYRLAPQNPFPAALSDAFVAYLSLLHPPPGAPHAAIPADKIIVSGDSAGGNLSLALLQLLLQLKRSAGGTTPKLDFHGATVNVPLPAGVALNSPWCDLTSSMASFQRFAHYDYLPNSWDGTRIAPCSIWPTDPPRIDVYTHGSALTHPLVSPLAAKDWNGASPVWFGVGEELLADEGAAVACRMSRQGVKVVWEQYEAMPHCFALVFDGDRVSDLCYDGWIEFCKKAVNGQVQSKGAYVTAKTLEQESVDVATLWDRLGLTEQVIEEKMEARKTKMNIEFEARQTHVPESALQPKL